LPSINNVTPKQIVLIAGKKMEIKPINWSGVLLFMGPIAD